MWCKKRIAAAPGVLAVLLLAAPEAGAQVRSATVALKTTCPYGCWQGANAALRRLDNVRDVRVAPDFEYRESDKYECVMQLELSEDVFPDVRRWKDQFIKLANDAYVVREFEVTVDGVLARVGDAIVLKSPSSDRPVSLVPLREDPRKHPAGSNEYAGNVGKAFNDLRRQAAEPGRQGLRISVTGTIVSNGPGYTVEVREYVVLPESKKK